MDDFLGNLLIFEDTIGWYTCDIDSSIAVKMYLNFIILIKISPSGLNIFGPVGAVTGIEKW